MPSQVPQHHQTHWQLSDAYQFTAPQPPASEAAIGGLRGAWYWLRGGKPDNNATPEELGALSPREIEAIAPHETWHDLAQCVADKFTELLQAADSPCPTVVLIVPPGVPCAAVWSRWFVQHESIERLATPQRRELIESNNEIPCLDQSETPSTIECLDKWFIRHTRAIDHLRRLTDQIAQRRRSVVAACGSWAWAFLRQAVQIDAAFDHVLALSPFDGPHLADWLEARSNNRAHHPQMMEAATAEPVFAVDEQNSSDPTASETIQNLAAVSRGNPAVALHIWRAALRCRPEKRNTDDSPTNTVWVRAQSAWDLPLVPPQATRRDDMILHALLLHDGLSTSLLNQVLPFPTDQTLASLHLLKQNQLVQRDDHDTWHVTLLAYPDVRKHLANEGYLIDLY